MPCDRLTEEEFLSLFRFIAPDLAETGDDAVLAAYALFGRHVWHERFGSFYPEAVAYYVAHYVKMRELVSAQGSDAAGVASGATTSEHEGDLSRSYGGVGGASGDDSSLAKTWYGQQFLRIRRMAVMGAITRYG